MILGAYFCFLRPPLLPEDLRYMDTSSSHLLATLPGLLDWLPRVFWVMGSFIFTVGAFTTYVAATSFRTRSLGAAIIALLTGITSIGSMAIVNFIIASDFKWILLAIALLWPLAAVLYHLERPGSR